MSSTGVLDPVGGGHEQILPEADQPSLHQISKYQAKKQGSISYKDAKTETQMTQFSKKILGLQIVH